MLRRKKKASDGAADKRTYFQLTLPVFHLEILAAEADQWGVARGDFLTMLLRRKFGELPFERPRLSPVPRLSEDALTKTERYAWYLPERDVPKLRADCLRLGNITFSTWVLFALNDWVNRVPVPQQAAIADLPGAQLQTDFRPDEDSAAEPYYGLFAVDEKGRVTGGIWAIAPGEILLFGDREEARRLARTIPGPRKVPGSSAKEAAAWVVRGVSSKCLKHLQESCHVRPVPGVLRDSDLIDRLRRLEQQAREL
jgi:hypothetical protein